MDNLYKNCVTKPYRNMKPGDTFIVDRYTVVTVQSVDCRQVAAWGRGGKRYKRSIWTIRGVSNLGSPYTYNAHAWERPLFNKGDF